MKQKGGGVGLKVMRSCVLEAHLEACGSSAGTQQPDGGSGPRGERILPSETRTQDLLGLTE